LNLYIILSAVGYMQYIMVSCSCRSVSQWERI